MKLYNVTVRVVDLVWAESPGEAIIDLGKRIPVEFELLPPEDGDAFVSEPSEEHGWDGDVIDGSSIEADPMAAQRRGL